MPRGRPPLGPAIVDQIDGYPEEAQKKLRAILEVIAGTRTADDACEELGVSRAYFYILKNEVLHAALEALLPRPIGRPRKEQPLEDPRVLALAERVKELESELEAAELKAEIARTLPRIAARASKKKGKTR